MLNKQRFMEGTDGGWTGLALASRTLLHVPKAYRPEPCCVYLKPIVQNPCCMYLKPTVQGPAAPCLPQAPSAPQAISCKAQEQGPDSSDQGMQRRLRPSEVQDCLCLQATDQPSI